MEKKLSRQKFVELCEKRVTKTIKDIRLIGNLSNRTNYKYDENDTRKILKALKTEISNMEARFNSRDGGNGIDFKL
tara:strand:+ start:197 stop:424 length:228 start_codon:yes stop_codon:yes gene_type:complete